MPSELTTSLATIVAISSRCSGCSGEQVAEALDDPGREVARAARARGTGRRAGSSASSACLEAALGVRQQHAQLGALHAGACLAPLGHLVGRRAGTRSGAPAAPSASSDAIRSSYASSRPARRRDLLREDLRLQVVVVEHVPHDVVGHGLQQLVALLAGQVAALLREAEQDLEVDLVVGAVDAGRVVDRVGVDAPAGLRVLDAAALREAEVAALADDARAQVAAVDADGVVRAVADLGVRLVGRLHERADAAVPEQVDLGARGSPAAGRSAAAWSASMPSARAGLGPRAGWTSSARDQTPPPGEIDDRVVVRPRRRRQLEQPPALGEGARRVGVGIDEDVAVVERRDQPQRRREQHPVAEHVAGHVADADGGEGVASSTSTPSSRKCRMHRLPGAARRDAERLVVVAGRAAGGERVAEPEADLLGDGVGGVGERRRALVGRDHEVRVVVVQHAHVRRDARPGRRRGCRSGRAARA